MGPHLEHMTGPSHRWYFLSFLIHKLIPIIHNNSWKVPNRCHHDATFLESSESDCLLNSQGFAFLLLPTYTQLFCFPAAPYTRPFILDFVLAQHVHYTGVLGGFSNIYCYFLLYWYSYGFYTQMLLLTNSESSVGDCLLSLSGWCSDFIFFPLNCVHTIIFASFIAASLYNIAPYPNIYIYIYICCITNIYHIIFHGKFAFIDELYCCFYFIFLLHY